MNTYGQIVPVAVGKILPLQHARHRVCRRDLEHIAEIQLAQPLTVEKKFCFFLIDDFKDLLLIGASIGHDLLPGKLRPGLGAVRGITDQARKITEYNDQLVSHLLKGFHLVQHHGMTKVNIGR